MWRSSLVQHATSMFGQIAAGLPLLIIVVFVSRVQGLEQVGKLTVVIAISAAAYSVALWEFRSYVVLDKFKTFSPLDYASARSIALVIATIATIGAALWIGISLSLAIAVVLYRICDAIVDLVFAFNLVWRDTSEALRAYAIQNALKLAVLCGAGAMSFTVDRSSSQFFIAASGLVALCGTMFMVTRDREHRFRWHLHLSLIAALFFKARWFAIGTLGVIALTSAPRTIVVWLYQGDLLGVVGASLSITTFWGMAFFTTWLRYLPRFNSAQDKLATARTFLAEITGVAVIAGVVSFFVLPSATGIVFGFHDPRQLLLSREVLVAGVIFFGSMSLANLYKVTPTPWMESVVYLVCAVVVGAFTLAIPTHNSIAAILMVAGLTMLAMSLLALRSLGPKLAN